MNLAMYPVIPQPRRGREPETRLSPPVSTRSSPPQGNSPKDVTLALQPCIWRVTAGSPIPTLTLMGPYPSELLLGMNTSDHPKPDKLVQVKLKDGDIICDEKMNSPREWMLHLTPARDRHEQNVEALRDARGAILFRTIKEIPRGEELLVWYSAELAMECGIPILTPAHIRSDQDYGCTNCEKKFRYPNTLKAHMRFQCIQSSMPSLLSQYSSLQSKNLLNAYQQELSKYFSYLGTLWNMRKMPMAGMNNVSREPNVIDLSPRNGHAESKSAFRPCANSVLKQQSSVFSPIQSPLESRLKMTSKSNSDKLPSPDSNMCKRSEHSPKNYPSPMPFPSVPPYLDPVYMQSYAQYLHRPEMSAFSPALGASIPRMGFPSGMEYTPAAPRDSALTSRSIPGAGLNYPEYFSRGNENRTPDSDRESPATIPVPNVNFPLPSESAGEPIDLLPKSLYMSKAYKGHLCIYCGKLYSRKYGLKIHLRTHTGYKPLKCKVCLRPFGDPSNLNKHIRLHAEGETPYRCDYCGKVLVRRRDLERHIKSRHPNHAESLSEDGDDRLCDTDTSFIDVDDDVDEVITSPIDMRKTDIQID